MHNLPSRRAAQTNWTIILGVERPCHRSSFFPPFAKVNCAICSTNWNIFTPNGCWLVGWPSDPCVDWREKFCSSSIYCTFYIHTYIITWKNRSVLTSLPYSFAFTSLILGLSTANLYVIIYVIFFATKRSATYLATLGCICWQPLLRKKKNKEPAYCVYFFLKMGKKSNYLLY